MRAKKEEQFLDFLPSPYMVKVKRSWWSPLRFILGDTYYKAVGIEEVIFDISDIQFTNCDRSLGTGMLKILESWKIN